MYFLILFDLLVQSTVPMSYADILQHSKAAKRPNPSTNTTPSSSSSSSSSDQRVTVDDSRINKKKKKQSSNLESDVSGLDDLHEDYYNSKLYPKRG